MKLNFSFDSIENINRNVYFFDDRLFRQNSEKQKSKQISLLNAFQQNLNKGNQQKIELSGIFGSLETSNKPGGESLKESEEIGDPIFFRTWELLMSSNHKE